MNSTHDLFGEIFRRTCKNFPEGWYYLGIYAIMFAVFRPKAWDGPGKTGPDPSRTPVTDINNQIFLRNIWRK